MRHGGIKLPNGLDISGWWRLAHSRNDEETVVEAITPCYPSDQKDTGAKGGDERQIGLCQAGWVCFR